MRRQEVNDIINMIAGPEDPVFCVYYLDLDIAYLTPWNEEAVQDMAESEAYKNMFYFITEEPIR